MRPARDIGRQEHGRVAHREGDPAAGRPRTEEIVERALKYVGREILHSFTASPVGMPVDTSDDTGGGGRGCCGWPAKRAPGRGRLPLASRRLDERLRVAHRPPSGAVGAGRTDGSVPEWPKGTGCKPVGSAYSGSNPLLPTTIPVRRVSMRVSE